MKIRNLFSLLTAMLVTVALLAGCGGSTVGTSDASKSSAIKANVQGEELKISFESDDQSNPRVVYMPDKGLYFSVWEDYRDRNRNGADIYGQFIKVMPDPDGKGGFIGTMCGDNFLVSKDGAGAALAGNQTLPDVAYNQTDGNLVVVWQDTESAGAAENTTGFLRYVNISGLPSSSSCSTPPAFGAATFVGFKQMQGYSRDVNYTSSQTTIGLNQSSVTTTLALSGNVIMPGSVKVTGAYQNKLEVVAADGTVSTTTTDNTISAYDDYNGNISGTSLDVNSGGSVNYSNGKVTINLSSVTNVAPADITVSYSTTSYAPATRTDTLLSRKSPRISYDPVRKEFWIVWVESRNTNNVSSVRCFGAPITWQFGDSNLVGYLRLAAATLAPKTNGLGVTGPDILRNEVESGHRTLFSRMVSHTAATLEETYTFEYFSSINSPVVASDPTSQDTLIAWEGVNNTGTISCTLNLGTRIISSTWSTKATQDGYVHIYGLFEKQVLLPNTFSTWIDFQNKATGTNPAIAVDDASSPRKFLVAWEDMRDGANTKIYGQLINSGGGLYNSNRILSYQDSAGTGTNDSVIINSRQTRPTISYDPVNQRYFVMWQDERNSSTSTANIDLYGQFVNLDGSLSGANYSISSNPSNQLAPAIAYDSNLKQFLALWKDARNINPPGTTASDIYGQLFTIGQPQLTLLTATSPATQLIPAVHDFGPVATGSVVTWNFTVKNTGDVVLVIYAITQLPSNPFVIAPTNAANLAPGSSATYTITYTPTSSGTYNSAFTLTSNGGSQKVALSATGVGLNPLGITSPTTTALDDATPGVSYSVQMVAAGGYTPLTWSATGLPPGLGIDKQSGLISGSTTVAGKHTVVVTVTDGNTPAVPVTRSYTLSVGSISIAITPPLSSWTQGIDYKTAPVHNLTAIGGTGSIAWMLVAGSGTLPGGISLSPSGEFSGVATSNGQYSFTVKATDSAQQTAQSPFSITINPSPTIQTSSLSSGVVGVAYSQVLTNLGGTVPFVWSISGGLPPGLSYSSSTGTISGTPSQAGTFQFPVTVTDSTGAKATKTLSIAINTTLDIATPTSGSGSPTPAVTGSAYSFALKANEGGTVPYTWAVSGGSLPAGIVLDPNTGILSGSPTAPGTSSFVVKVTDLTGASATKTFTVITVSASSSLYVQLVGSNGTVASYASVATTTLTGLPAGFSPYSAAQMQLTGITSGATVTVAVSFASLPASPVFYKMINNAWVALTPDSIVGNTIFYQIKDRVSATDTDPLALRDSNLAPGVIDDPIVVGTAGTSTGGGTTSGSGGGGGCFIATAAFGSYLDPHVMVLRHFRDDVLLQSGLGTAFVKFYYKHSPPVADFIAKHEVLRTSVRFALTPLIFAVKYPLAGLVLLSLLAVGLYRVARRKLFLTPEELAQT